MNKKFRKLILPVSILATSHAYALGLGDLQVYSVLDEELNGQIPIIVDSEEDITNISVELASSDDYKRVDLDKSFVPSNIKVNIVDENNKKYIVVTSKGPVSEPIVSLLLSVDWANGHLLREYTILLDPPLFNTTQTQQNYSDPVKTDTYKPPVKVESEEQTIPSNNSSQNYNTNSASQVVVEAGDTLWKIAGNINQGYGSQQQMMVALFNNNPTAFTNNDMNRLKKGSILEIPKPDQVTMLSTGEAIAEVKSHLQNWSNLQTQDSGSSTSTSSSSVDYGIELVPPNDSDSSDSYNSSGTSNDSASNRAELSRLKEQLASTNLENDELSSRIYELEQIVKDQEMALNLKDNSLAQLQQQIAEASNNESSLSTETSSEVNTNDDVWDDSVADSTDDTLDSDSSNVDNQDLLADNDGYDDAPEDGYDDASEDGYDDENLNNSDEDNEIVTLQDEPEVQENDTTSTETQVTSTPASEPATERSFMDKVMDYKFEGLIGLGALILAGLAFVFMRRKKEDEDMEEGNFLDSISNNKDTLNEDSLELENDVTLDDLNESHEEYDLNISDSDLEDVLEDDLDEAPEVVVMDDQSDDESEEVSLDIEDFNIDDIDLDDEEDNDLDYSNDNNDSENNLDLDFDENSDDQDDESSDEFSLDLDLDDLDFSNDNDIDDTNNLLSSNESAEEDLSLDFDSDDDSTDDSEDDFTLDLDTDNLEIDEPSEDFEFDLTEDESILSVDNKTEDDLDTVGNLEFDLSDDLYDSDNINVDSDDATPSEYESVSIDIDESKEVDIGLDLDDIIDDDAIDTKLDLAKAYFEMGDVDGAKQMVLEILEEGSDEQKQKAKSLKKEIEG